MGNLFLIFLIIGSSNIKEHGTAGVEILFSVDKKLSRTKVVVPQEISFPGAVWLNDAGEPDLPSLLYKIGIPQGGDVDVTIVDERGEVIKNVLVEPVKYAGIYEQPITEIYRERSKVYKENKFFPKNVVEVSQPGYFRDIYTVDVRLNPVQYNPVTKELRVLKNVKINIGFNGRPRAKQMLDTSFEEIYSRTIANYEQCRTWLREPERDNKDPFSLGVWFKIEVDEEGIYRIGYDEIKDAGLDPQQFDPKTMKIYNAAFELLPTDVVSPFEDSFIEIPVYVQGEDDQSFDKDDYLIFYGYPASHFVPDSGLVSWFENGYARNNVYWFTFGGDYGMRMEEVNAAWNGTVPDTVVNEILHIEENLGNPSRSGINWYWLDVSPGEGPKGSGSVNIEHLSAGGEVNVTVGIFTLEAGEFWYQLSFDGDAFFSDTLDLGVNNDWPPYYLAGDAELDGDSSVLTIDIIRPSGTGGTLKAYFNAVDIQYERITDMSLSFHAFYPVPYDYSIKCSDASSPCFVFDITDFKAPKMFYNMTYENNTMIFSSKTDSFQLLYFSKSSLAKSAELIQTIPGKLRDQSPGCGYLFITHKNFYNAIMPLVHHRRQEYTTRVVVIDDIYNDFSFGKYDPLAIKHFLYYTTNNWTTVPKYVLLVGDATYDYKNNLGKQNPPNFIPMYESGTKLYGNPGIPLNHIYEGEYVNFGTGEAMVLGRITVRTNQEVRDFIDKVITYETGSIDGMWNKRIILAGDDEYSNSYGWESPYSHCGLCENNISHIPDSLYDLAKIYMVSYPPFSYPTKKPNAQNAFIRELSKGGLAGVYYGHGNTHQLADEGLFYDINIPQIKNGRRYFFFYFGSCTVGRFDDSDYECIGEQLVRMKDGAIGTIGETGGSGGGSNGALGDTLFSLLTKTDLTMGECFNIARRGEYLLLGDPATKLRRVEASMEVSALPDSLRPLEKLKITTDESCYYLKAFVRDTSVIDKFDKTTEDKISGYVYREVGPSEIPFGYEIDGKEIYQGWWDNDTAIIIAPKIVTTDLPVIKLSTFNNARSGVLDSIRVYGTAVPVSDQIGPVIALYDGARKLKDDDWVSKEFSLTGKVSDENGVNLLNSVNNNLGFFLYVNRDIDNKVDLRDHFLYDRNSYTSGEFNVGIDLPKSKDTITINVADNDFNQTVKTIVLNVEIFGQISIENFLIYPNPLQHENKGIWFTFNLTDAGLVTLKIFTIAGRLIKTVENVSCSAGYNQIFWNSLDEYQDEISNGVYFVKAFVEAEGSCAEVIEKFIIAR